MPSKFVYSPTLPKEILSAVKDTLEKYEALVPGWVKHVNVSWIAHPNEPGTSAESRGDYAYRWASIYLCPTFLDENEAEREDTLIHELVHVMLFPLTNYYSDLVGYLDDQPDKVRDFIRNQTVEKMESVTVDVTTSLLRGIKGPDYQVDVGFNSALNPPKKGVLGDKMPMDGDKSA
jgi:hypothetical protein